MRILLSIAATIAVIYIALVTGLAVAMRQPPDQFGAIMAKLPPVAFMVLPFRPMWMRARAGSLEPGEMAPDFALKTTDRASQVRLSSFRGRQPVVLVFGSYT